MGKSLVSCFFNSRCTAQGIDWVFGRQVYPELVLQCVNEDFWNLKHKDIFFGTLSGTLHCVERYKYKKYKCKK